MSKDNLNRVIGAARLSGFDLAVKLLRELDTRTPGTFTAAVKALERARPRVSERAGQGG